jgi:hypothetical protein
MFTLFKYTTSTRVAILLILILLSLVACSKRRTRQFIVPDTKAVGSQAGAWTIAPPSVVAFRDVIDLDDISDTTMFWISFRAKKARTDEAIDQSDLIIDSVRISFRPDGAEFWRSPTRVASYGSDTEAFIRKAFDFFGDQGIVIPAGVDTIIVQFEALTRNEEGSLDGNYPIVVEMVRDESSLRVPLLQQ